MHSAPQPSDRDELAKFDYRVIVAGTRGYEDYEFFSEAMKEYVGLRFGDSPVIFITGRAKTGADALIIRWCIENGYPWVEFPADWYLHGKGAGYSRNAEMAKYGTHLCLFYDGTSKGTRHMADIASKKKIPTRTFLIDVEKEDNDHGWKSRRRRSGHSEVHREAFA